VSRRALHLPTTLDIDLLDQGVPIEVLESRVELVDADAILLPVDGQLI